MKGWATRHRAALITVAVTLALDVLAGVWYAHLAHLPVLPPARGSYDGLDWATSTLLTTGDSGVVPVTRPEHWLTLATRLLLIPLGGASISIFAASLTATHVHRAKDEIKAHVTNQLGPEGKQ